MGQVKKLGVGKVERRHCQDCHEGIKVKQIQGSRDFCHRVIK